MVPATYKHYFLASHWWTPQQLIELHINVVPWGVLVLGVTDSQDQNRGTSLLIIL